LFGQLLILAAHGKIPELAIAFAVEQGGWDNTWQ
jgi:hypothetical protein